MFSGVRQQPVSVQPVRTRTHWQTHSVTRISSRGMWCIGSSNDPHMRQSRRVDTWPATFPYPFRYYCPSCGVGSCMLWCEDCDGEGYVLTKPGEAGVPFRMGLARCKTCSGIGVVACPHCGGREVQLPPPDPERGPCSRGPPEEDAELSLHEWLGKFG